MLARAHKYGRRRSANHSSSHFRPELVLHDGVSLLLMRTVSEYYISTKNGCTALLTCENCEAVIRFTVIASRWLITG